MRYLQSLVLNHLPVSFLRKRLANTPKRFADTDDTSRQLLIDVSAIAQTDAGTGIQRVVRNLYQALLASPPEGYRICPVAATRKQFYAYLPTDFLQQPARRAPLPIQVRAGDIFLGLDLSAHLIPHHMPELFHWKQQGVHMSFVIYDLLPVLEPAWFNPKATHNFHRWLRAMAILANDTVAISRTVQTDFSAWMQQHFGLSKSDIPCATIPLGAELDITPSRQPATAQPVQLPPQLNQHPFILMVGTIEPRKAYADVLDAFETLWTTGNETRLVIVGKQGWKVEALIQRLQTHTEIGKRLVWLNTPDDTVLRALYQQCQGVLMASKGEGYGLPLIEAAYFNKPMLVRDIPIFREIVGNAASYFSGTVHSDLLQALLKWLNQLESSNVPEQYPPSATWQTSSEVLQKVLFGTDAADKTRVSNTPSASIFALSE
jgi:glycosyltransferase involved in cell wall biosynthesis